MCRYYGKIYYTPVMRKTLLPTKRCAVHAIILFLFFAMFVACSPVEKESSDTITISYWEKWTGFEHDAMQAVVDKFNEKQIRNKDGKLIRVKLLTVSQIDRKLLVATAGGNPPDVAGIWNWLIVPYADKGALVPLDGYIAQAGIKQSDYIPAIWDICEYRGSVWGLPSTPASLALHWNKRLFRKAGLDPERPPHTIAELDGFAEKLTLIQLPDEPEPLSYYELKFRPDVAELIKSGEIVQMGFLPFEPNWWLWCWGYWFGGKLWDGKSKITADAPENIQSFDWVRSYTQKYGVDKIRSFISGVGAFSSPQNPFLSGEIAMEIQGIWMANFIEKYSPGMEWGAAPFPSYSPDLKDVTLVECDALVIPRGAEHPDEAFEFIRFVNKQENMELLCSGQRKFSPLAQVSDEFYQNHRNPYVRVFRHLAESPNAFWVPELPISQEYLREMGNAFEEVRDLQTESAVALKRVTTVIQKRLDQEMEMLRRRGKLK